MNNTRLVGKRVVLREKRLDDAYNDYRWRLDEELARLDAAVPLRMGYNEFLRCYQEELNYPSPWSRRFAIETKDGLHIGNCMYYDIDFNDGTTELGILTGAREYWGGGYGTEAVATLLHHIFTSTPIHHVYLHTLDWNLRAKRCFEKCGFTYVRLKKRGSHTFHYMELHKKNWLSSQQGQQTEVRPPTVFQRNAQPQDRSR